MTQLNALSHLLHSIEDKFDIFVCDNYSTDDSLCVLHTWLSEQGKRTTSDIYYLETIGTITSNVYQLKSIYKDRKIELLSIPGNLGYAGGNNVGIQRALENEHCEFIWILNNDTIVAPQAFGALRAELLLRPEVGLCGAIVRYYQHSELIQSLGGGRLIKWRGQTQQFDWHYLAHQRAFGAPQDQLAYINGACVMVPRRFIETIGFMEEEYFLYYEEADWAARAFGKFSCGVASNATVYHKVGKSIGTSDFEERSLLSEYFLRRSRLIFCKKHFPFAIPIVLFEYLLDLAKFIVRRRWSRALIILKSVRDFFGGVTSMVQLISLA